MLVAIIVIGTVGSLLYLALMRQPRYVSAPASLHDVLRNASALHKLGHTQRALQVMIDARALCDDRIALEVRILEYQEYIHRLRSGSGSAHSGQRPSASMTPAFLRVE
ncbi:MAG: hypothetical protein P1U67_13490 [Alcanivoracaceae bacterium]|nr:hypothetical protein [Alcanivoracaceae bacterium]